MIESQSEEIKCTECKKTICISPRFGLTISLYCEDCWNKELTNKEKASNMDKDSDIVYDEHNNVFVLRVRLYDNKTHAKKALNIQFKEKDLEYCPEGCIAKTTTLTKEEE